MKKILIFIPGGRGNFLLLLPFILSCTEKYQTSIFTYDSYIPDFKIHQLNFIEKIENLFSYKILNTILNLKKEKFDFIIIPAYIRRKWKLFFKFFISKNIITTSLKGNEFDANKNIFNKIGIYEDMEGTKHYLLSQQQEAKRIEFNKINIGIFPGSSKTLIKKRYPSKKYRQLIQELSAENKNINFYIFGFKDEEDILPDFNNLGGRVYNLINKITFSEQIYILNKCDLNITNDNSGLHLSMLLGKKTIAVFGPTDSEKNVLENSHTLIIKDECEKMPCYFSKKIECEDPKCLKNIPVEKIKKQIKTLIGI